ncbi:MAG: aldehyde dehydrogenase family protein [Candidatus Thorarchaeota archaeon]
MVQVYSMYIDGEWVKSSSGESFYDYNPYDGSHYATVPKGTKDDVKKAIDAAYESKDSWAALSLNERASYLDRAYDASVSMKDDLVEVLIKEAGSIFKKAAIEAKFFTPLIVRSAAEEARRVAGEILPSDENLFSLVIRQPVGVVAAITPFNVPLVLSMKKVLYALAFGNTVVLKPSSETPVIGLKVAELFEKAGLPKGVLNVVTGPGNIIGEELVNNPKVSHISFTGDTTTGRKIAEQAGKQLKKVTLELGGSDPLIVLKDADLDYSVDAAVFGAFFHQGQNCISAKRLIVEKPLVKDFTEKLVKRVSVLKVGDPSLLETDIGPLINRTQLEKVHSQVQDALDKGANLLYGGKYEGLLYWPTLLNNVSSDMSILNEEVFGPARPIVTAEDANDAVRIANDTTYGLSSGIISNNTAFATELARKLENGMVHINDSPVHDEPNAPFGGVKGSGMGREGGKYSMFELTETKWITIQSPGKKFPKFFSA